ncbi:MAG: glycosyl transferase [Ponticaulis sp.]|nr:glycosyl transferase [Ponticaulis sp.]|tara:strand:+ start:5703 stop:6695 length:993 start_codon:yes stop_codon:yes gene_type:complete
MSYETLQESKPESSELVKAGNRFANGANVAVIVPCYNEELTIESVVQDFRQVLPEAKIYVFDNNSSDRTSEIASNCGAIVRHERRQGKGFAIRRAFADVDAEIILMVDGDATYDASAATELIQRCVDGPFDYVNGARIHESTEAYRPGHEFGNKMLTGVVAWIFGRQVDDMLSGYKALSRRFIKSFPASSTGFEIETELMVHALELGMPISEIQTKYKERPPNSVSKLNTFRDGFRILLTIVQLVRRERPFFFFSMIGLCLFVLSVALSVPVILEYFETGLVRRLPTFILSGFIGLLAVFASFTGLILDLIHRGRHEVRKLAYLSFKAPS